MLLPHDPRARRRRSTPDMRRASRDRLSLALMDARNHTLHAARPRSSRRSGPTLRDAAPPADAAPPLWLAGHVAWLAEYWIARNPQRALGPRCPARRRRGSASVEPQADAWFDPTLVPHAERWQRAAAGAAGAAGLPAGNAGDHAGPAGHTRRRRRRAVLLPHGAVPRGPARRGAGRAWRRPPACRWGCALPAGVAPRAPLLLPATRWTLGWTEAGLRAGRRAGPRDVAVPEFEIDAQPVSWAQYVEFIDDGGYDRQELWHPEGWAWLEREAEGEGRRGPRHVEQIGVASGAVLQTLFGKPTRMSRQPAGAARDAGGRPMPGRAGPAAACRPKPSGRSRRMQAARRGFRWGDVREWTAGTLRPVAGLRAGAVGARMRSWMREPCSAGRACSAAPRSPSRAPHEASEGAVVGAAGAGRGVRGVSDLRAVSAGFAFGLTASLRATLGMRS